MYENWLTTPEGQHCLTLCKKHGLDPDVLQIAFIAGQVEGVRESSERIRQINVASRAA